MWGFIICGRRGVAQNPLGVLAGGGGEVGDEPVHLLDSLLLLAN